VATKNLARTVIEGGRTRSNRYERRASHAPVRQSERTFANAVVKDPSIADSISPARLRPVWKEFRDKLGPLERWLRSHTGEPWDDVYSEIARRFDTRTVPGRHVVFCHLLPSVRDQVFEVGPDRILRECARRRRHRGSFGRRGPEFEAALEFVKGRRIGRRGDRFFWFEPTFAAGEPTGHFRQARCLTAAEERRWQALPEETRARFVP